MDVKRICKTSKKVEVEKNLENLEMRNIQDLDFSPETYRTFKTKFKNDLELIDEQMRDCSQKVSNHKMFIDKSANSATYRPTDFQRNQSQQSARLIDRYDFQIIFFKDLYIPCHEIIYCRPYC